jgi:hypothetical protein
MPEPLCKQPIEHICFLDDFKQDDTILSPSRMQRYFAVSCNQQHPLEKS